MSSKVELTKTLKVRELRTTIHRFVQRGLPTCTNLLRCVNGRRKLTLFDGLEIDPW
jgi:hypothetical protein